MGILRALTIAAFLFPLSTAAQEEKSESGFEQKLLATIPEDVLAESIFFSPYGRSVAFRAISKKDGQSCLFIGEKRGEPFDVVLDPQFSPDGSTLAYEAKKGESIYVIVGERKSDPYDMVFPPVFSPTGHRVAYAAMRGKEHFVVVDEKRGETFNFVGLPVFSPDGKSVAYPARFQDKGFIVCGSTKLEAFDGVGPAAFSPDGKTLAYGAIKNGKACVVRGDQKETGDFDLATYPVFSRDGKSFAYRALKGDKWFVMFDGKKGENFDSVTDLHFTARGEVVYVANLGGHSDISGLFQGGKYFVVVGQKKGEAFEHVWDLRLGPDGNSFAYCASDEEKKGLLMVGDARKGTGAHGLPVFSPDSRRVAVVCWDEKKFFIALGETVSETFEQVGPPRFNSDGTKIAFGARKGSELWWRVMNLK